MAKYIMLMNWTDQGIKTVKDSPNRLDAAREAARKTGVTVEDFFMTLGVYDMVTIVDAPDDAAFAKFVLATAQAGNIRTSSLKAFTEEEYRGVVGGL
jgi:uncharacterized protein with GYD domain